MLTVETDIRGRRYPILQHQKSAPIGQDRINGCMVVTEDEEIHLVGLQILLGKLIQRLTLTLELIFLLVRQTTVL